MAKQSVTMILRHASIMTGRENLEPLYTYKNFPVFFGCVTTDSVADLQADMQWMICPETGIIQLSELLPLEILYQAQHMDGTGSTWQDFYQAFADYIATHNPKSVLEIGGGQGKIADVFTAANPQAHWTIVEPNPLHKGSERITIVPAFFDKHFAMPHLYDLVTFSHTWEHAYDPHGFIEAIAAYLEPGQKLVFAYPHLALWLKNKNISALTFEHTMLLTDYFVDYLLAKYGFTIVDKHAYKDHSWFYTAERSADALLLPVLENRYEEYKKLFLDFIQYYQELVVAINARIPEFDEVYVFGAHIFSQYLFQMGLNANGLLGILDNSPLKQGKRLYGSHLRVYSPTIVAGKQRVAVILKVGAYRDEIAKQLKDINPEVTFLE